MNKIIILLLYVFLKLFAAQRFLSGSSSKNITLWNNVQRLEESKENFDVYSIDYLNEIFVSATSDNTVKAWNISSFSVVFQTPATQSELKYVVILNQSTCLAGYSKKIYFWSFPNLKEKKPIDLATLNEIQIFKLLKEENLVLIGSLNGKFHVFSLLTENVLDSYNQAGYALDGLNRNVIVSNCKSGICSFYLNSNNQINVNKTVSYSNEVYVAKLINSSLALFGVNELKLIIWDLKSSQVNQIDSDNAKIRSIEILDNDTFLTGMESDKIIVWNLKSITIKHIITTTGIIYALKKIDFDWNFPNGNSVSKTDTSTITTTASKTSTDTSTLTTTASKTSTDTSTLIMTASKTSTDTSTITTTASKTSTDTSTLTTNASKTSTDTSTLTTNASKTSTDTSTITTTASKTSTDISTITTTASKTSTDTSTITTTASKTSTDTSTITTTASKTSTDTGLVIYLLTAEFFKINTSLTSFDNTNYNYIKSSQDNINLFDDIRVMLNLLDSKGDLNDCLTNCSGHGQCKLAKDFKFICECFENYAGSNCALNTLPCWSNPCLNNGTCINNLTDSSYTCDCQRDFYFGKNCEFKKDVCANETCSKNGYCYDENNKAKCECFSEYFGDRCESESNELKIIKNVIKISSIIATIIIIFTYVFFVLSDLLSVLINKKQIKKVKIIVSSQSKIKYKN